MIGVGRSSYRKAIGKLMEQSIFQKSNGRGTYLRQFPIVLESGLKELTSVTEHIRKVGAKPSTQGIQTDKIPAINAETDKISGVKSETDKIPGVKAETDRCIIFDSIGSDK